MITMDDYFKAPPHERAFVDSLKPHTNTHRRNVILTARMIAANRERERTQTHTPTHRGVPQPLLDQLRIVNTQIGRNR